MSIWDFIKKPEHTEVTEQVEKRVKEMRLIEILADEFYTVSDSGQFLLHGISVPEREHLRLLLNSASIAADSTQVDIAKAILEAAAKAGITRGALRKNLSTLDVFEYTTTRKYSAILTEGNQTRITYLIGDYEETIDKCNFLFVEGKKLQPLNIVDAQKLLKNMESLRENGERVLIVAYKEESPKKSHLAQTDFDKNFVFIGMLGFKKV